MHIYVHIDRLYSFPVGLQVMPIVRCREESLNLEVTSETPPEIIESLDITVRPVYLPVPMAEVDIRYTEYAVIAQQIRYFYKFPGACRFPAYSKTP